MKGLFVVVEGPNCTGKSTAVDAVANAFRAAGWENVEIMKDPSSSPDGYAKRLLEDALLRAGHGEDDISDTVLAMLYTLNRIELYKDIQSLVEDGFVVVCDRWFYSTIAYQGGPDSILPEDLACIQLHCGIKSPDLILHLDVDYPEFMKRRAFRRMETQESKWTDDNWDDHGWAELRRHYARMGQLVGPGKWITVDTTSRPAAMVYGMVTQAVKHWLDQSPEALKAKFAA